MRGGNLWSVAIRLEAVLRDAPRDDPGALDALVRVYGSISAGAAFLSILKAGKHLSSEVVS